MPNCSLAIFDEKRSLGTVSLQNLYNKTRIIANFDLLVGTNTVWPAPLPLEKGVIESFKPVAAARSILDLNWFTLYVVPINFRLSLARLSNAIAQDCL